MEERLEMGREDLETVENEEDVKANTVVEDDDFDEKFYNDTLKGKGETQYKEMPIFIIRKCGYDFDNPYISVKNAKVNKDEYEKLKKKDPENFNRCPFVVGYWIINMSYETIKGVIAPHYELNPLDNKWYGIEETIDLEPEDKIWLPTKYLIYLLMRDEYKLKCGNGRFDALSYNEKAMEEKDYDAVLNSIKFIPDTEWNDILSQDGSVFPISYYEFSSEQDEEPTNIEVSDEDRGVFLKRFGYLNNKMLKVNSNVNVDKNNKDNNSAKLLAGIVNLKK